MAFGSDFWSIDATLSYFTGGLFSGLPGFIAIFVALVGWIITSIFCYRVIKDALTSIYNK